MNAPIKILLNACVMALACHAGAASADERSEYNKRVATRFVNLFQELDRDRDGRVTRAEATGDLNFLPAFSDMDINGDNVVTTEELHRFIDLRLGVQIRTAAQ